MTLDSFYMDFKIKTKHSNKHSAGLTSNLWKTAL